MIRTGFAIAAVEWRRILSYRADFWLQMFAATGAHMLAAGFLWWSVYESNGVSELQGFSFPEMMLYYLTVSLTDRAVRTSDRGQLSNEIYEGTLSKFLVYPTGVFYFLGSIHLSRSVFYTIQIFILILPLSWLQWQSGFGLFLLHSLMTLGLLYTAALLYFLLASVTESVAFWADHVWSLLVLLRFLIFFCGGGLIPLRFFPQWFTDAMDLTPFPYLLARIVEQFTAKTFSPETVLNIFIMQVFWVFCVSGFLYVIWIHGRRKYSGVGQ